MLYSASAFFKSSRTPSLPEDKVLWEERILLIVADTSEEAKQKAESVAQSFESNYRNADSDVVTWVFVKVERVFEIEPGALAHGTELFSRYLRNSEVVSLLTPFDDA